MRQYFLLLLLLGLGNSALYGQINYYTNDSTTYSGVELINGGNINNSKFCQVESGGKVIRYTPYEIKEFGFKDGRTYLSKEIKLSGSTQKVFLERLVQGKMSLYSYNGNGIRTYFLEKDSTYFAELPKKNPESKGENFKTNLLTITSDCPGLAYATKLVTYNKKSLSKLTSFYNNCQYSPLPYNKFGIIIGYGLTYPIVPTKLSNEILADISFKPNGSILLGAYADLPIAMSNFSLHAIINFKKNGFEANSRSSTSDVDIILNTTTVDVPLLLRYTLLNSKWSPFIDLGTDFTYHLKKSNKIYTSSIDQNIISINDLNNEAIISEYMLGYSMSIGLQYNVDYRKIISAEFRYGQFFGAENMLNKNQLEIMMGFSF